MATMSTIRSPRPAATAGAHRATPPLFGRADLQIHTSYGDGMASAREIFDRVEQHGLLDVVAVTDHDDVRGALEARKVHARGDYHFELVTGIEVTTRSGHLLALWVDEPIPSLRPLDWTVAAIHRSGGVAVIPHPFSPLTRSIGRRSLERLLGKHDDEVRPDGIEVANQTLAGRLTGPRAYALNREHYRLAETGGSDAHFIEHVGSAFTLFPGRTSAELRQAIEQRRTFGVTEGSAALGAIGLRRLAWQQVRGLRETPRRVAAASAARLVRRFRGGASGAPAGRER
jgi:predicted metal-dependent phosphoesterase TrpH